MCCECIRTVGGGHARKRDRSFKGCICRWAYALFVDMHRMRLPSMLGKSITQHTWHTSTCARTLDRYQCGYFVYKFYAALFMVFLVSTW